jgi:ribonuclease Z
MRSLSRVVTGLAALLFAGIGLTVWMFPNQTASRFGLQSVAPNGLVTVRADIGGLFIGLGIVAAVALVTRRRSWSAAAAVMLGAVATGRAIGWIANGESSGDIGALALELVVCVALASAARATVVDRSTSTPRRNGWRAVAAAILVFMTAGASTAMFSPRVQQLLFDRAARANASSVNRAPLSDDALRVAICGSSAPLPSASRAKPCVAVFAGGKFYIVDVGPESVENLVLWGIPLSSIGGVLLTHYHSDHIGDLGELNLQTWAGGRPGPVTVYGGPGVERVVDGFNEAYRLDQGYRTAHHTEAVMPSSTWPMIAKTIELNGEPTPAKDRTGLVLDDGALRITAIEVDHAPISPAYAYRFDYKGRSALITGDLKYHPVLAKAARGVDVMVSEAIAVQMTRSLGAGAKEGGRDRTAAIMHDIEDYHITPEQSATLANEAGVKLLVFYHLLPSPDGVLMKGVFGNGVEAVRKGAWTIADDGSLYTLPLGSDMVQTGRVRK